MPAWLRPSGGSLAEAARRTRFRRPLRIPAEITDAAIEIPIRRAKAQLLPGRKTELWTYGGTFPGPTIRRPAGAPTSVTFTHQLGAGAGELSAHLHGGHNRSEHDGQPGGLTALQQRSFYCDISPRLGDAEAGNDVLIAPGQSRTYEYEGMEDGEAERGSFQWYHDHRLDNTARNVWRGLAGMWITDDPAEDDLDLPTGARDIPLMICDRAFDKRNRLTNPFKSPGKVPFDQVTGRHIMVNGAITPHAKVAPRRHRLRLLNTSNFRAYNLRFSNGLGMLQLATEAGLMPTALRRSKILLGPGERVEIVVDFASARGKRIRLESVKRPGARSLGAKPYVGDIMEFRVGGSAVADDTAAIAHGDPLRPLPAWVDEVLAAPLNVDPRPWTISVEGGIRPRWLINGRTFDPAEVDRTAEIGEVVTWRLRNNTQVAHLMHLHHTDWYMLRRNGATPPPHERCLKETFLLDPFDEIVVAGKMSGGGDPFDPAYTGKYVVHCHMLDHEDHGLMSQFEVVEPTPTQ